MAAYSEIIIEQYANYSTTINVEDVQGDAVNLTSYTASAKMKKSHYSSTYNQFNVSISNASTGELTMSMSAANTANLSPGRYFYDLVITSPTNEKTRVIEGIAVVTPGVTS